MVITDGDGKEETKTDLHTNGKPTEETSAAASRNKRTELPFSGVFPMDTKSSKGRRAQKLRTAPERLVEPYLIT